MTGTLEMAIWWQLTAVYLIGLALVVLASYAALPWVARRAVGVIVGRTCTGIADDIQSKRQVLLERGQQVVLAGPSAAIVGHLVQPYLERLTVWFAERFGQQAYDDVRQDCIEACLVPIQQRRFLISLAVGHVVMVPLIVGFLLRGAF